MDPAVADIICSSALRLARQPRLILFRKKMPVISKEGAERITEKSYCSGTVVKQTTVCFGPKRGTNEHISSSPHYSFRQKWSQDSEHFINTTVSLQDFLGVG